MAPVRGKQLKQPLQSPRPLAEQSTDEDEQHFVNSQEVHVRIEGESRPRKHIQDKRFNASDKGKMQARSTSPPLKKRKSDRVPDLPKPTNTQCLSRRKEVQESDYEPRYYVFFVALVKVSIFAIVNCNSFYCHLC